MLLWMVLLVHSCGLNSAWLEYAAQKGHRQYIWGLHESQAPASMTRSGFIPSSSLSVFVVMFLSSLTDFISSQPSSASANWGAVAQPFAYIMRGLTGLVEI